MLRGLHAHPHAGGHRRQDLLADAPIRHRRRQGHQRQGRGGQEPRRLAAEQRGPRDLGDRDRAHHRAVHLLLRARTSRCSRSSSASRCCSSASASSCSWSSGAGRLPPQGRRASRRPQSRPSDGPTSAAVRSGLLREAVSSSPSDFPKRQTAPPGRSPKPGDARGRPVATTRVSATLRPLMLHTGTTVPTCSRHSLLLLLECDRPRSLLPCGDRGRRGGPRPQCARMSH